jgi:UDP-N-acetylglucosamine--N-acetylmuramyl-(pentapeptide) pyrophosphoryl-undecaprenol N-acetylglucosamine transferase
MGQRVMILAGGTGGHVYPALAVARELLDGGHEVIWMGTRKGLEGRVVPEAGIPVEWLSVAGIRGKGWLGMVSAPFMLLRALRQARTILRRVKPEVVLGMGGFVSGPGGLIASLQGIPLVLHEQNRIPGTTNQWLAGRASAVLEAFPGSFKPSVGACCTGNPLRRDIAGLPLRTAFRQPDNPIRILVVGGSLGAKALNETVPAALAGISQPLEIRHQTGAAMREETEDRYARSGLKASVTAFVENMADAYAWADLAICRAGAMTVSELAAAGLPAILIPYPHAIDDHQTQNARFLADAGAAVMIPQGELSPAQLSMMIGDLVNTPGKLVAMSRAARSLARPEAAGVVAAICLEQAGTQYRRGAGA